MTAANSSTRNTRANAAKPHARPAGTASRRRPRSVQVAPDVQATSATAANRMASAINAGPSNPNDRARLKATNTHTVSTRQRRALMPPTRGATCSGCISVLVDARNDVTQGARLIVGEDGPHHRVPAVDVFTLVGVPVPVR